MASTFRLLQSVLVAGLCSPFAFDVRTRRPSLALKMGQGDPLREATGVRPSIHPVTINAIAEALKVRAQNKPDMPLRMTGNLKPFDIALVAGKIAQEAVKKRQETSKLDGMELTLEEEQTVAGRIFAVVMRFEDLEAELNDKCEKIEWIGKYNEWSSFGVLEDETSNEKIDKKILGDPLFGITRAECLLAIFLETIEGPGLQRNNVTIPCMDVDFLDSDRYDALFGEREQKEEAQEIEEKEEPIQERTIGDPLCEATDIRPSLHPVTINAVAEALKIRAQNKTTAPLRRFNDDIEWFEIQLAAGRIAEQAVTKRQKTSEQGGIKLTDEEAQTVGGRIVAVIMRFDDLEWELNHRCNGETWITRYNEWDNFGILRDESCIKTLDERILSDPLFTMNRAKRLLALFLLNVEGPGMKASGQSVPGGSDVDFLDEDHYKIMMPKDVAQASQ